LVLVELDVLAILETMVAELDLDYLQQQVALVEVMEKIKELEPQMELALLD
jgi:uncharacterized coiled-coil protein SlyX